MTEQIERTYEELSRYERGYVDGAQGVDGATEAATLDLAEALGSPITPAEEGAYWIGFYHGRAGVVHSQRASEVEGAREYMARHPRRA